MERYETYKDSGVEWIGEIPEGWEVRPVWSLSTCNDEVLPEDTDDGYEFNYVDISSVSEGSIDGCTHYSFSGAPSRARRIVKTGDVIVSTVRTYLKSIATVDRKHDGCVVSTGFAVLRHRADEDSAWFGYVLSEDRFVAELVARSVGVSYPAINASELVKIKVCRPSMFEQRAIAAYLDAKTTQIDALIADCEQDVQLLREYRKAVISEAVTKGLDPDVPMKDSGVEWIGEIPEGWEIIQLKRLLLSIEQGWSPPPMASGEEEGWKVLSLASIRNGIFKGEEVKPIPSTLQVPPSLRLSDGDFLMTRANTRDRVGDVCLVKDVSENVIFSDLIYRFNFDLSACIPRYLLHALLSSAVRYQLSGAAQGSSESMPKISRKVIESLLIVLPPLPTQRAIASYLDAKTAQIDALIADREAVVAKLREYRKSLISEAVTGKFKVPGV